MLSAAQKILEIFVIVHKILVCGIKFVFCLKFIFCLFPQAHAILCISCTHVLCLNFVSPGNFIGILFFWLMSFVKTLANFSSKTDSLKTPKSRILPSLSTLRLSPIPYLS